MWLLSEVTGRTADDLMALADALDARDLALIVTLEQDGGDGVGGAVGNLPHVRERDAAVARRAAAHIGRLLSSARSPGSGKLRQVIRDSMPSPARRAMLGER